MTDEQAPGFSTLAIHAGAAPDPATGARGTVTPIASAYQKDDRTCHDFLASYVKGAAQSWLQGEACKPIEGAAWEVRSMKPWKRS